MLMCIQNLVKFCPLVLKILSGNENYDGMTEIQKDRITELQKDRQGKSSIAPTFSKQGYNKGRNSVANLRKMTPYYPNLDLTNVNVYTKFG